jgi:hypothetical protein
VCMSNVCTVGCNTSKDCTDRDLPVCVQQQCRAQPDSGVGDASSPDEAEAGADAADALPDAGACAPCPDGGCGQLGEYTPQGPFQAGPTTNYEGVPPNTITGQRIHVPVAGCLVKLGVFVSTAVTARNYYLGLYSDVAEGGYPDTLVWRSQQPTLKPAYAEHQEIDVDPPIHLDAKAYWIVSVWDEETVLETADPANPVPWASDALPTFDSPWDSPFPPALSDPPALTVLASPNAYAIVSLQ